MMDKTKGYYGVFLNEKKSLEFHGLTTDYESPVPLLNGRCGCAPTHGALTDLNLWSEVLGEEEVVTWARQGAVPSNIWDLGGEWKMAHLDIFPKE